MELPVTLLWWVDAVLNALFGALFAPIGWMPGWLSITILSAVFGVVFLFLFKQISNQKAIGRVKDRIDAELLAVKLFKDNIAVTLRSQAGMFVGAFKLLYWAAFPMLVLFVPVSFILVQMGLWYQNRPFLVGDPEPVVIEVRLDPTLSTLPEVALEPSPAVALVTGPVRVPAQNAVYFKLRPTANGYHDLAFRVGEQRFEKSLAVGSGLMRVNPLRPGQRFWDLLIYPLEKPFSGDSPVRSIRVDYPERDSRIYGADYWVIYFFVVSMVFAYAMKPVLKVRF